MFSADMVIILIALRLIFRIGLDNVDLAPSDALQRVDDVFTGQNPECSAISPLIRTTPRSTTDIQQILRIAKRYDTPVCVKSGGHSYTCNSVDATCVQIDLKRMKRVARIEEDGRHFLSFQTGALVSDLLKVAPEDEFTFVHGECHSVGTGGYYLHGGVHLGWGGSMYGIGSDHIHELDITFANETTRTVRDRSLIRTLTKAGSSFGLVSRLKLEIFKRPSPKTVLIPILSSGWTVASATETLTTLIKHRRTNPSWQLNFWLQGNQIAGGVPLLQVAYLGDSSRSFIESHRAAWNLVQSIGIKIKPTQRLLSLGMSWALRDYGWGYHFRPVFGYDALPYASSNFIANTTHGLQLALDYIRSGSQNRRASCLLLLNILGRTPMFGSEKKPSWFARDEDAFLAVDYTCSGDDQRLAQKITTEMEKHPVGSYSRYYNIPSREASKCRYWNEHYAALMRLKQEVDPQNVFDVFQGIHFSNQSRFHDGDCDTD